MRKKLDESQKEKGILTGPHTKWNFKYSNMLRILS